MSGADFILVKKKAKVDKVEKPHIMAHAGKTTKSIASTYQSGKKPFCVEAYRQYCVFYNLAQGCQKGSACRFKHELAPEPPEGVPRSDLRRLQDVCRIEVAGKVCRSGRLCPFWHTTDQGFRARHPSCVIKQAGEPLKIQADMNGLDTSGSAAAASTSCPSDGSQASSPTMSYAQTSPATTTLPDLGLGCATELVAVTPDTPNEKVERLPFPEEPQESGDLTSSEQVETSGIVQWTTIFSQGYTAVAEGYLTASSGARVMVQFEQDEWLYGFLIDTSGAGWFPRDCVLSL